VAVSGAPSVEHELGLSHRAHVWFVFAVPLVIAQAHAYEELPSNPGAAQAIARAFVIIDVVAPLALGLIADRFGLGVAIGCLAAQPVVIVACAARVGRVQSIGPGCTVSE
jgi:hypothetical protein